VCQGCAASSAAMVAAPLHPCCCHAAARQLPRTQGAATTSYCAHTLCVCRSHCVADSRAVRLWQQCTPQQCATTRAAAAAAAGTTIPLLLQLRLLLFVNH
jgi:hypothetical protein